MIITRGEDQKNEARTLLQQMKTDIIFLILPHVPILPLSPAPRLLLAQSSEPQPYRFIWPQPISSAPLGDGRVHQDNLWAVQKVLHTNTQGAARGTTVNLLSSGELAREMKKTRADFLVENLSQAAAWCRAEEERIIAESHRLLEDQEDALRELSRMAAMARIVGYELHPTDDDLYFGYRHLLDKISHRPLLAQEVKRQQRLARLMSLAICCAAGGVLYGSRVRASKVRYEPRRVLALCHQLALEQ